MLAVVAHLSTASPLSPSLVCYHLFAESGERGQFPVCAEKMQLRPLELRKKVCCLVVVCSDSPS